MKHIHVLITVFACVFVAASMSSAQAADGGVVGGVVAAGATASTTQIALTGSMAFRINRFLGFGVELTSLPALKPDAVSAVPRGSAALDGHATAFTTDVRFETSPIGERVVPYVVGGGGVAGVKSRYPIAAPAAVPGLPVAIPDQLVSQSSTDLAIAVGGGVNVLVAPHVSFDVDLRYLRLIGDRDVNIGRFGIGASYRF